MGKNGALLREQKKQHGYFYTNEQIAEIKRKAVEAQRDRLREETRKYIEEEFARRSEKIKTETAEETMQMVLSLLIVIPVKCLVEEFRWTPVSDHSDGRCKLRRFSEWIIQETNTVFSDDNADIKQYIEECYEKYGIRFEMTE